MFDNVNVNLHKEEGFLTSIPCIPIPEYGQSNACLLLEIGSKGLDLRGHLVLEVKIGCASNYSRCITGHYSEGGETDWEQ